METNMTDAIVSSLFYDNLQIACIAICLVVACALSIYNLPWEKREWDDLMKAIKSVNLKSLTPLKGFKNIKTTVLTKADLSTRLTTVINGERELYRTPKSIHSGFPIAESE